MMPNIRIYGETGREIRGEKGGKYTRTEFRIKFSSSLCAVRVEKVEEEINIFEDTHIKYKPGEEKHQFCPTEMIKMLRGVRG